MDAFTDHRAKLAQRMRDACDENKAMQSGPIVGIADRSRALS